MTHNVPSFLLCLGGSNFEHAVAAIFEAYIADRGSDDQLAMCIPRDRYLKIAMLSSTMWLFGVPPGSYLPITKHIYLPLKLPLLRLGFVANLAFLFLYHLVMNSS